MRDSSTPMVLLAAWVATASIACSDVATTGAGGGGGATSSSSLHATSGVTSSTTTSTTATATATAASTGTTGSGGPCPARSLGAGQVEIYGEGVAPEWACYGFSSTAAPQAVTVCSGGEAMAYTAHQYDGFQFQTDTAPIAATHLSVRVHVDQDSDWTIAAVKPGEPDPHQFLGNPTIQHWITGWQDVELDIPATTPSTRWILFEHQSAGDVELVVDDLRLTQ